MRKGHPPCKMHGRLVRVARHADGSGNPRERTTGVSPWQIRRWSLHLRNSGFGVLIALAPPVLPEVGCGGWATPDVPRAGLLLPSPPSGGQGLVRFVGPGASGAGG